MKEITFLGTGTSQGVPIIGCTCAVCQSTNPKDKRLRSSIWVKNKETHIIIDTGPDFRYQALRAQIPRVDGVLFTHAHKDHIAGLDDIRAYNHIQNESINLYADQLAQQTIKKEFEYAFNGYDYPGIPRLNLNTFINNQKIKINDLIIEPIQLLHYKLIVYGFRIHDFTYITDANYIAPEEFEKIKGTKILVLNALRREKHISHFSLDEAIEIAQKVNAEQTYFTHISHQLGLHDHVEQELPSNIFLAYDQLKIRL